MRTFSAEELNEILENHKLWLSLCGESGSRAILREADLRGANLREANLRWAALYKANLSGADLRWANLRGANLLSADLRGANLSGADLRGADLRGANLSEANLRGTDLRGANLGGAYLREAKLNGANFSEAKLRRADLSGSDGLSIPLVCPEEGSFIAFKRCRDAIIVKLEVTEDALRSSSTTRKCRCSKAKVLSITNIDGTDSDEKYATSIYDSDFIYEVGKIVEVNNFDTNRFNECTTGIHFFITREEAVNYEVI